MDILNLKDLEVLEIQENTFDYLITAQAKERPKFCIKCYSDSLIRHSTNEMMVSDVRIHDKRTKINLIRRRYKCKSCGYTFYELLSSVDTGFRTTKRLRSSIEKESLKKTFKSLEEEYAISNMTARRIFDNHIKELEKSRKLIAPRVLGIDEAHLNYKMRGVLTDTENNRLIEITEDNNKPSIKKAIQSMEGWKNIEIVTMDMAKGYRYTVNEILPKALVVIDKFHVVQYAQMALSRVRVDYKNSLKKSDRAKFHKDKWLLQSNAEDLSPDNIEARDRILEQSETLTTAYWFKEMIREMYRSETKRQAHEWFYTIESSIPKGKEFKVFRDLFKTYNNCKPEIMNYFDARYTNAYTESINNQIKRVEKAGAGYSYEVLRAKCIYGLQQPNKPKFGSMGFKKVSKVEVEEFSSYFEPHCLCA